MASEVMQLDGDAYTVTETHIDEIQFGDLIVWDGVLKTVGRKDLKHCSFMGRSLYGDCHKLGTVPVLRATIIRQ